MRDKVVDFTYARSVIARDVIRFIAEKATLSACAEDTKIFLDVFFLRALSLSFKQ